ncbi:hypothetical protein [Nitrosomonas oligotropha]|uniref:hypothetical protein n=1 Tax=Nitrosomonas oligotropha TaxID=42354 RepID=UPI001369C985|nr:hypothetical protein [Nitrosomonas oligotropha]
MEFIEYHMSIQYIDQRVNFVMADDGAEYLIDGSNDDVTGKMLPFRRCVFPPIDKFKL